jgi:HSP20 family protein
MGFFDDDPFEDILREFFSPESRTGRKRNGTIIQGEEEDRIIDFVEEKNKVYLIFELPGYNEKDIMVIVKNKELEIRAQKNDREEVQTYLAPKLSKGFFIRKTLPKFINPKRFSHTMRNGILEVVFNKK